MRRQRDRRRATWALAAAVLGAGLVTSSTPAPVAEATSIVPFAVAFTDNDNGSIAIFGNNLMVCPATHADCAGARAGTNNRNNNSFDMVHLDVDGATFPTFSSSSAQMVIPADAEVQWAGLYWGARLGRGTNGANAVGDGRQMKLRAPGDTAYRTITANRLFGPSATADRAYQARAVVTDIVRAAGPGTYFGADVPAATGEDRHAGWSLVIVYRSPSLPLRNLTVFDGLADVGQNDPQIITISGFTTPVSGAVNARIGLVAYEGDNGSTGDRAILRSASNPNGTLLATRLSQGTNFFNGANDDNGTLVTTRNPADRNMLGFDIKNFDGPDILGNNETSATIDLASTSERYFPGVVTTAIDVFAPDFSPSTKTVTNLTGGDPARVGDTLRYTVTFVNAGQDPAINTSIIDPIPAGTSYVSGSLVVPPGVTGSFNAATNSVEVSPGDFPVGRSVEFTFDVQLEADAANSDVANQATIIYDGATVDELQDLRFTTGAASIAVVPSADLVVTKVNTPDPVVAGQPLTSTITVRNGGPSPAADVVVTDELPPGLGAVTATPSQGTCTLAADLVTCGIGTLAPAAIVTVTVQAAVPPNSDAAALTDIARVTSSTADPDPDDNTAGASTEVTRNADLSVTKAVSAPTVSPGGTITYTITVINNGPSTATSVVIDDAVPDPRIEPQVASSVPAGTCTTVPSGARCTIPSLAPGASAVMTVSADALPSATPGPIPNDAIASSATPDADDTDNTVTQTVTIGPPVSALLVTKTANAPDPLIAGIGEVRYTIDVANDGPSDAQPVTVTDTLPAGFSVVSATTDRGTCTFTSAPTGDTVTCDLGRLIAPFRDDAGASGRITIVASVGAGVGPGEYPNVATADAPSAPPTSSPPAPVTVEGLANVAVVKSFPQGSDSAITPGTTETYRIRVVNDGPSAATDVVVTDVLPTGFPPGTFTATAWRPPSADCDLVALTCDLGDLPPGATVELELDVDVDGSLDPGAAVTNTASVTTQTPDPNPDDNTSIFTVSSDPQADLSIRKIAPTEPPIAGDTSDESLASRSFRIEIVNFGPSEAAYTFTDTLPPGVTFERIYDLETNFDLTPFLDCTVTGEPATGQTVSCSPPADPFALPPFVGTFFELEFSVDATIPAGTVLENGITVESDVPDGNPGNNSSTALVAVRAVVNLTVEKLVVPMDANGDFVPGGVPTPYPRASDPLGVAPGLPVSFAVVVTNNGPSAAADVQFIDSFPLDAEYLPVGDCEFLNGETICPYSRTGALLPPGGTFGVQIITILEGDTAQGVYTNTGRGSTSTTETTLADNVDTRPIEVIEPVADLIIEKDAVTSPLVAGEAFTYQVVVSAGRIDLATFTLRLSSDAEDVVVTDTLPAGLIPAAATPSQGSCTVIGQAVRCELGTVESSISLERQVAPTIITITGTVAPSIIGVEATNTAVATSATPLLGGGTSRSDSTTTPITRNADLTVTKIADSPAAAAGGGITFTVTVANSGPSDATGVVLTDLLPSPLLFSAAGSDPSCGLVGGSVECAVGTVAPGESRAVAIAATLPPGALPGSGTNTASVDSDTDDLDGSDDASSVPFGVTQQANLSITKTPAGEGVLLGESIAYTLVVVNDGPSNATAVVVTESIPPGTTVATLPAGCTGTGPVTCTLGTITAGDTRTLEIVLDVPETTPLGPLPNTASVTSATEDPDLDDNTSTATVEAIALADVVLDKALLTSPAIAGEPLVYTLTLTNLGPTIAPSPSLSDPLPPGTTFVSFTAPGGTCQLDEVEDVPAASCSLAPLAVGASVTATLTVDTDPSLLSVANTGFSGSGGLDENPEDNEDTVEVALVRPADLSVTKTGPAAVSAVAAATYTIGYRNDGPASADSVVVTDTLPAGLTPRATAGCTIAAQVVSCAVGTVAAGASGTISIVADVGADLPAGTALVDTAAIRSDDPSVVDPDLTDNTASLTSTVTNDIAVDVRANQTEVRAGDPADFTVVVTNNGPEVANDVVLSNALAPELVAPTVLGGGGSGRRLPVQVPTGCLASGLTVTCQLGDLDPLATRTFVFGGRVADGTPAGTRLVHTATVTVSGIDAIEANNVDTDVIIVIATVAATTTTTTAPGGGGGGGGSLPVVGAAIAGLLALASILVVSGGGLRAVAAGPRSRRRRRHDDSRT